jgi:hypothetical protein
MRRLLSLGPSSAGQGGLVTLPLDDGEHIPRVLSVPYEPHPRSVLGAFFHRDESVRVR